ncbi:MAG: trigger factor [Alphaproteobacteria bacterium]|nr:trigger factor [Alphaproteobacteria bacterium]
MKVLTESSKDLRYEFKIEIASQDIEAEVEQSLIKYGKTAKLPGFRPGKIPLSVLRQKFDEGARQDAINAAVKQSVGEVLKEKSLQPASSPKIELSTYNKGDDLVYTMEIEVLPSFEIQDYTGIKVTKLAVKLTDKDVDDHLIKLLEHQKRTVKVEADRKSQKGDTVVIDATASNPDFDASEQGFESFHLLLGNNHLETFDEKLVGKKVGDVVDIEFTLPENFPNKPFAGKTLNYHTTIKEIREPIKPEITEEIAKEFGFENLEALRKEARDQLQQSTTRPSFLYAKRQILDSLSKQYSFQLPQTLLDHEFKAIWEDVEAEMKHETETEGKPQPSDKEIEAMKKKYLNLAERRVRLGLVLSEISKKHEISVPKEKIAQAVMQAAKQHKGYEKEAFEYYFKNPEANAQIRAPLLEDEVMHFLLDKLKTTEKELDLDAFKKELETLSDEG